LRVGSIPTHQELMIARRVRASQYRNAAGPSTLWISSSKRLPICRR
jgi:hypothetical protein